MDKHSSMTKKHRFLKVIQDNPGRMRSYGVKEIGVFGSVARGEDKKGSDFDVLVVFEKGKKSFRNFAGLVDFLEMKLGAPVELVTRESLSPYIGPRILKEVEYVPIAS